MGFAFRWSVGLGALTIGVYAVLVGASLLPAWAVARTRDTTAQLTLTWVLIGGTLVAGLLLAGFLFRVGRSADGPSHTARR